MRRLSERSGWVAMAVVATGIWAVAARGEGPTTAPAGAAAAAPAAAPAGVDNPQYALWAHFRPGSSTTVAGDMGGEAVGKVHLEVTQTLVSVAADVAKVSQVNQVTLLGKTQPGGPPTTQVIPAKEATAEMRQTGTADVQAMGKTFPCKVYDVAKPGQAAASQATAYVSPDVPGGIVKLVLTGPNGKSLTFLLTAMTAK